MSTDRLRRAEEVYFTVLDLPPDQRPHALRAACGADDELRRDVESLLAASDQVGAFLAAPALGSGFSLAGTETPIADDLVGVTLGHYRIDRRLGAGGMGAVYQASRADAQYTQQVAVKVVKRGMDSEEIVRRFRRERQTLAALNHPNIARLIDGGMTGDGRPYLVMEYVAGVTLDAYCAERSLPLRQRLDLFMQIAGAVSHAHRNLVVHRDLKPGNILVTAEGVPKLLDFGIASVLARAGTAPVTLEHERRLTPEYASPEQIRGGPVTTATDVYSLGVILYELLTGRRPYEIKDASPAELERAVCTTIPSLPSATVMRPTTDRAAHIPPPSEASPERLRRVLRGDLDTITLMALRKEPERRYVSVDALIEDISRYVAHLPVRARRDTVGYRVRKFVRRNALACALAAVIAVSLAGGVGAVLWQSQIVRRERDAAYLARDQAEAVAEFFQKMMADADPASMGTQATLTDWLAGTAGSLEPELRDRPLVLASVHSARGRMYTALNMVDRAEAEITAALEAREHLLPAGHHDLAESRMELAAVRFYQNKLDDAERLLREALQIHRGLRGEDNTDTARVWNDLGAVLRKMKRLDEAEQAHTRALTIRKNIYGGESIWVAESLNNLSGVALDRSQPAQPGGAFDRAMLANAERLAEESLRLRRTLLGDRHQSVPQSLQNLAVMAGTSGDWARAVDKLREAAKLNEEIFGADHPAVASTLGNLGFALRQAGQPAEAEPAFRRAIQILERRVPTLDDALLMTRLDLGKLLLNSKPEEGASILEQVFALTASDDPKLVRRHNSAGTALAAYYRRLGRDDDAARVEPKR